MKDSDHWCTPPEVLVAVWDLWSRIDLDPCSNPHDVTDAEEAWWVDGLTRPWAGRVWVNPPYSKPGPWLAKAATESGFDCEVLALVKHDHTTKWWRESVVGRPRCLWGKRVKFLLEGKPQISAPFPSTIVYFGNRPLAFRQAFEPYGEVVG